MTDRPAGRAAHPKLRRGSAGRAPTRRVRGVPRPRGPWRPAATSGVSHGYRSRLGLPAQRPRRNTPRLVEWSVSAPRACRERTAGEGTGGVLWDQRARLLDQPMGPIQVPADARDRHAIVLGRRQIRHRRSPCHKQPGREVARQVLGVHVSTRWDGVLNTASGAAFDGQTGGPPIRPPRAESSGCRCRSPAILPTSIFASSRSHSAVRHPDARRPASSGAGLPRPAGPAPFVSVTQRVRHAWSATSARTPCSTAKSFGPRAPTAWPR
jgi:hypothetical protein